MDNSRRRPIQPFIIDRLVEQAGYEVQQKITEIKANKELSIAAIYEIIRIILEGTEPQK